jgi:hypothetical protein
LPSGPWTYDSPSQTTTSRPAVFSIFSEASTSPLRVCTMVTFGTFFAVIVP